MPKEYIYAPEMDDYVQKFIDYLHEFTYLREGNLRFKVVYTVNTDKDGNPQSQDRDAVLLKKVSPLFSCVAKTDYIVDIDEYQWINADTDRRREYYLHRALAQIDVEIDEKRVKTSKRAPDMIVYASTAQRYTDQVDWSPLKDIDSLAFNLQFELDSTILHKGIPMPSPRREATVRSPELDDRAEDGEDADRHGDAEDRRPRIVIHGEEEEEQEETEAGPRQRTSKRFRESLTRQAV